MSDFRDLSRLPVDQAYWEDLESRIVADIGARMRARGVTPSSVWAPLAARAWSLGGLALAAGLAVLLLIPERVSDRAANPAGILRLPDDDGILAAVLTESAAPPLASLVVADPERDP